MKSGEALLVGVRCRRGEEVVLAPRTFNFTWKCNFPKVDFQHVTPYLFLEAETDYPN